VKGAVHQRGSVWYYKFRLPEPDPSTGRYPWITKGGFDTEREAMRDADRGRVVKPSTRTVAQFLTEWLAAVKPALDATTWRSWSDYARSYSYGARSPVVAHYPTATCCRGGDHASAAGTPPGGTKAERNILHTNAFRGTWARVAARQRCGPITSRQLVPVNFQPPRGMGSNFRRRRVRTPNQRQSVKDDLCDRPISGRNSFAQLMRNGSPYPIIKLGSHRETRRNDDGQK
jgi:hypothetical protein